MIFQPVMQERVLGWHILPKNGRLRFDLALRHPNDHETISVRNRDERIGIAFYGMHAATNLTSAIEFAFGAQVCLVELHAVIDHEESLMAARSRTILARLDCETMFLEHCHKVIERKSNESRNSSFSYGISMWESYTELLNRGYNAYANGVALPDMMYTDPGDYFADIVHGILIHDPRDHFDTFDPIEEIVLRKMLETNPDLNVHNYWMDRYGEPIARDFAKS